MKGRLSVCVSSVRSARALSDQRRCTRCMSRKKHKIPKPAPVKKLGQETLYSIWGLLFCAAAVVMTLAAFQSAGSIGEVLWRAFSYMLGWGYVFLPIMLLGIGINFLVRQKEAPLHATVWLGALLFLASVLGFIDVVAPYWGGVVGNIAGYPQNWFGSVAWGVITFALTIIGILVVFDRPLRIQLKTPKPEGEEKEKKPIFVTTAPPQKAETAPLSQQEEDVTISSSKEAPTKMLQKDALYPAAARIHGNYVAPPLELLKSSSEKPSAGDLRANANIIRRTLEGFGIPVEMGEINIGPKVTRYTLRPAEGVKLSRITALNQDLALALSAHPIRIEAPIPGKPYVGIEVPNKSAALVRLGNLITYPDFAQSGPLGFVLGRDVTGEPIFANLDKMPHLLIAGATGSGKSITLHSILISLLYKNSPQTLRLILIDPKRVELSAYNSIPHIIGPVITQGKKALSVFRWAISEMERRYELLLKAGARDVQSYNKKNAAAVLPFIIIIVDEMADLMTAFGRDVENAVVRLAQMARATGIHLILSTQRPSVEVITGLIKANITARIALQVASQVDSRTILDNAGAEKLLGGGDFLFVSAELSKPKRIQGCYVSEEEIKNVADFIRDHNKDLAIEYADDYSIPNGEGAAGINEGERHDVFSDFESDKDDELLDEAIEVVRQAQKASASLLQRRLKIGYARAARLLDLMEERGIVGPGEGAKPRDVYISRQGE